MPPRSFCMNHSHNTLRALPSKTNSKIRLNNMDGAMENAEENSWQVQDTTHDADNTTRDHAMRSELSEMLPSPAQSTHKGDDSPAFWECPQNANSIQDNDASEHENDDQGQTWCERCGADIESYTVRKCTNCDSDNKCPHCDLDMAVCSITACPTHYHCQTICTCPRCYWCDGYNEKTCSCQKCDFCEQIPMQCRCVGPATRRINVPSEAQAVNVFNVKQEYDAFDNPLPKTVVLNGNINTIITISDPIPEEWYEQYDIVKRRASSTIADITKTVARIAKPLTDKLEDMEYQSKVREYTDPSFVWPENSDSPYTYVRTPEAVSRMVDKLVSLPRDLPWIGIDMEAFNLGHQSGLCLLQIRDEHFKETFLVDLLVLQGAAFDTPGTDNRHSLRTILEDPEIPKSIFDVRQDSCALFAQAGIRLHGMVDLQIMYMLTYPKPYPYRTGMKSACRRILETYLGHETFAKWLEGKEVEYPADKSIRVWQQRPLSAEFQRYAAGDVELLGILWGKLSERLSPARRRVAVNWTTVEVARTWCTAKEWDSSGSKITPGFEQCFEVE